MDEITRSIELSKIIAILRGLNEEENIKVIGLLIESGILNIEIALNTENALEIIKKASTIYKDKANIGAGTVINAESALNAINAGAQFLIAPNLSEEAIKIARVNNILIIPGVYTPSEIVQAQEMGCKIVKLFPAVSAGSNYIKQIKSPLNNIKIVAVGGINMNNAKEFLAAGTNAFGVGNSLIPMELVKNKDYEALKTHINLFMEAIK